MTNYMWREKCFKPLYDCEIKQKYKNRILLNNGNLSEYRSSYMKPNLITYLIKKGIHIFMTIDSNVIVSNLS